jgi:hypothetical protein
MIVVVPVHAHHWFTWTRQRYDAAVYSPPDVFPPFKHSMHRQSTSSAVRGHPETEEQLANVEFQGHRGYQRVTASVGCVPKDVTSSCSLCPGFVKRHAMSQVSAGPSLYPLPTLSNVHGDWMLGDGSIGCRKNEEELTPFGDVSTFKDIGVVEADDIECGLERFDGDQQVGRLDEHAEDRRRVWVGRTESRLIGG